MKLLSWRGSLTILCPVYNQVTKLCGNHQQKKAAEVGQRQGWKVRNRKYKDKDSKDKTDRKIWLQYSWQECHLQNELEESKTNALHPPLLEAISSHTWLHLGEDLLTSNAVNVVKIHVVLEPDQWSCWNVKGVQVLPINHWDLGASEAAAAITKDHWSHWQGEQQR